jgi:hypothetical protein
VSVSSVFDTAWQVPHQSWAIVTAVVTLIVSSADMAKHDPLDFLLDLDGEVIVQDRGYWVKIEARRRNPSPQVPHGIDYSLTLHDKYGKRVLGLTIPMRLLRRVVGSLRGGWSMTIGIRTDAR